MKFHEEKCHRMGETSIWHATSAVHAVSILIFLKLCSEIIFVRGFRALINLIIWWNSSTDENSRESDRFSTNHGKYQIYFSCLTWYILFVCCVHTWGIKLDTRNKCGISKHPCIVLYINDIFCSKQKALGPVVQILLA